MFAANITVDSERVDFSSATVTYNRSCAEKMQRDCELDSGHCYYKEDQILCVSCCLSNFCNDRVITENEANAWIRAFAVKPENFAKFSQLPVFLILRYFATQWNQNDFEF